MQVKAGKAALVAGTVTKDAEYKTIGDANTPVASFSVAVNARGESGVFANCKAFGNPLANYARHIKKGDAVFAVGVLESREYNGKTYTDLSCQWLNYIGKTGSAAAPASMPQVPPAAPQQGVTTFDDDFDYREDELPF
jgi:single-stranded DNA-binding protein